MARAPNAARPAARAAPQDESGGAAAKRARRPAASPRSGRGDAAGPESRATRAGKRAGDEPDGRARRHVAADGERGKADAPRAKAEPKAGPTTAAPAADPLQRYRAKRDFTRTPEPADTAEADTTGLYVIQKHDATRLHYDFRLELDGVLLSWAVPKGPSFDPADKRMAVRTEDHPVAYAGFEGTIPPGQYGAGRVIVWDRGRWTPIGDPRAGLAAGKLAFELHGEKLAGTWELIRPKPRDGERQEQWLLFKKRDAHARPKAEFDVVAERPDSVLVDAPRDAVWDATKRPQPAPRPATTAAPPARGRRAAPPASDDAAGVDLDAVAPLAPQPDTLSPQLATLASEAPGDDGWLFETKFDGYRIVARIRDGEPRLFTRNGHDWTDKLPALADALRALGLDSAWIDGELVALGARGVPDFNALQNAFDGRDTAKLVFYAFDLPYAQGRDLREVPLQARRGLLQTLLGDAPPPLLRFSEELPVSDDGPLAQACRRGLEGVIAKRLDAPYRSTRSATWLKLKCRQRQEFVVGGFADRANASAEVGSLILGVHDATGELRHAGSVGTGWNAKTARELHARLQRLRADTPPFADGARAPGRWSRRGPGSERWVRPELVVEVEFAEWTPAGQIRHASFVGVREDKPAREIVRETPQPPEALAPAAAPAGRRAPAPAAAASRVSRMRVTHGERVVDEASGLTKLDLLRWYDGVAERMLPHLKGRAVAFVRAPQGIGGTPFFQKHAERTAIPGITVLDAALWPGHDALLEVATPDALLAAAQMNVVEFHTWNSTKRAMLKPDRMVFDLDPGEGVDFAAVRDGALLVKTLLDELGLASWLKTSGGKGLHVVVPLVPREDFDGVKAFSKAVVEHLAEAIPQRFVAKSGGTNRVGKIFVDYLRNGEGATTACAFSARARPGLGVSIPVAWDALPRLKSGAQWTVATAREHLSFEREDPWADYWTTRQTLATAMKRLGYAPARARRR